MADSTPAHDTPLQEACIPPATTSATNAVISTDGELSAEAIKAMRKKEEREKEKQKKMEKFMAKKDKQQSTATKPIDDGIVVPDGAAAIKPKAAKQTKETIQYETVFRETPNGEKKILPDEMPSAYSPRFVEVCWYAWWEKQGFFTPEYTNAALKHLDDPKKFVIVIPPPNVTGTLHVGHALANAVEDALTRWNRMCGRKTLWVPGSDHAGIATQVVVEKKLRRDRNLSRHDIGREAFVNEVWRWNDEKGHLIYDQLRRLGVSVDWKRVRFTMDPVMSRAVTEAFCQWHEKKIIYRDVRLINWSCTLRSAISDIEVEKKELTGRTLLAVPGYDPEKEKVEFGVLTSFAYKIEDSIDEIIVATTRPETMLGDTAIAVHPADERYTKFHTKFAVHPFIPDRRLPIVTDEFVDMQFGTGAVKITPAHDANDYEVAKRHNLPFISIFDDVGLMRPNCGQFAGMKRFAARRAVTEALKKENLFRDAKDHAMIVPICSRSKDIVEPMQKDQWFVNCKELGEQACEVVRTGELKLIPSFHEKTWFNWMENIRDWCISRQLWWGHRIPAYFVRLKSDEAERSTVDNENWITGRTREEALEKAVKKFAVPAEDIELRQDEDVLDTWFSSGLFPFSVFGWPEKTPDLQQFYPTSLLETGHDIIFFWVARMVIMGLSFTGKLPFSEVYLHAMVRDAHGRKMSKSLGNVIDPVDVIQGITLAELNKQLDENSNLDRSEVEKAKKGQKVDFPNGIPECGTDALGFALCAYTGQGRDINLDVLRVQGYRFFSNKLWNAMRFALGQLGTSFEPRSSTEFSKISSSQLRPFDWWILSRAAFAVDEANHAFESYDLPQATTACYNFWLYDLCDIYLECCKPIFAAKTGDLGETAAAMDEKENFVDSRQILYTVLDIGLRLIAPFMPFIAEELYQRLPRRSDDEVPSVCVAPYPGRLNEHRVWRDEHGIEEQVSTFMSVVRAIRSLRADYDTLQSSTSADRKTKTAVFVVCHSLKARQQLAPLVQPYLQSLSSSASITLIGPEEGSGDVNSIPRKCAELNIGNVFRVHLELGNNIDWDREISRASERLQKLVVDTEKLQTQLTMAGYAEKVPVSVREAQQEKLVAYGAERQHVQETIDKLNQFKTL